MLIKLYGKRGVFRRSDMTIKIKVLNVRGSVIWNIEKMGIGFFQFRVIILRYSFIFARSVWWRGLKGCRWKRLDLRYNVRPGIVDCAREIYCWSIGAGCVCMPTAQTEDRYLSNRMVGENIFDLFPASASGSLRAGFSTLWSGRK